MKGTIESITKTRVIGENDDAFDVVIKFVGEEEHFEFRTVTYEERYACIFAKVGLEIEIDLNHFGRLHFMQAPFCKYGTK